MVGLVVESRVVMEPNAIARWLHWIDSGMMRNHFSSHPWVGLMVVWIARVNFSARLVRPAPQNFPR